MAPGWMPPVAEGGQSLGICFTGGGLIVLVTWNGEEWTFPGGSVESGETLEETLIREVAEEVCATVTASRYLACQHIADPFNTLGLTSLYQTRWWARVTLNPWEPEHEMIGRRLVRPEQVLDILCRSHKAIEGPLLDQAVTADRQYG